MNFTDFQWNNVYEKKKKAHFKILAASIAQISLIKCEFCRFSKECHMISMQNKIAHLKIISHEKNSDFGN